MFRYLALVWNEADGAACRSADGLAARVGAHPAAWSEAMRGAGLRVWCSGARAGSSEVYSLGPRREHGVVLGKLFARGESQHPAASSRLTEDEAQQISASGGRRLIERYWGRYVAVLRGPDSRTTTLIRDPSAALPCLLLRSENVHVVVSSIETAFELDLLRPSIDWSYVGAQLAFQRLELPSTGIREVTQLLGGESIEFGADAPMRRFLWNPLDICGAEPIQDRACAVRELRTAVESCVRSWSSAYPRIVHTLSGGLDSSIVLACLAAARERSAMICVNYHSAGSNTDERAFARLAASRAGCELLERERDENLRLECLTSLRPSASPGSYRYSLENSLAEERLAAETGASGLFCGEGGDQAFYQSPGLFAAGDFLARHGLFGGVGAAWFRVALDSARMDQLSVWRVLYESLAAQIPARRWDIRREAGRFNTLLDEEIVGQARSEPRFVHPLFRHRSGVPSGKLFHAYQLSVPPFEFYDPLASESAPERVAPLLSQPVVETCLRIPTDVLTALGWDRAIARRAFRDAISPAIALRRTKGGLEEYAKDTIVRNMPFVREWLLDGALAQQGLVARAKLQHALELELTKISTRIMELYDLICAEAWARAVLQRRRRAADTTNESLARYTADVADSRRGSG